MIYAFISCAEECACGCKIGNNSETFFYSWSSNPGQCCNCDCVPVWYQNKIRNAWGICQSIFQEMWYYWTILSCFSIGIRSSYGYAFMSDINHEMACFFLWNAFFAFFNSGLRKLSGPAYVHGNVTYLCSTKWQTEFGLFWQRSPRIRSRCPAMWMAVSYMTNDK